MPPFVTATEGGLLESLAEVGLSRRATVDAAVEQLRRTGVEGLLVAVLGAMEADEAERLARLRHGSGACVAVLLDTPTWVRQKRSTHQAVSGLLASAGWRVLSVQHGTTLASVWPNAAQPMNRR